MQEKNQKNLSSPDQECDFCCELGSRQFERRKNRRELGMEVVSGIIEMNVEVACNNEFMKRSSSNGKEGIKFIKKTQKIEKDEDAGGIY